MKFHPLLQVSLVLALGCALQAGLRAEEPAPNTLTAAEKAAGWKLLFDGKTTQGWRNLGSVEAFDNFELNWEWSFPPKCNNGIKYFVNERRRGTPGPEFQMIDDALEKQPKHMTGSFYDVLPPKEHAPVRFAPEVNQARLVVRGNHVEHYLNGEKVLEYDCGSDEVKAALTKSKFKNAAGFGEKFQGPILLTDHSDECWFRSLKVRELPLN
jgi:Domain of Unknown Function (DUF1080)